MLTDTKTVYVRLLEEGTEVLRPALAVLISGNKYQILQDQSYDPDDEVWEFPPGTKVFCESTDILGKPGLIARHRA